MNNPMPTMPPSPQKIRTLLQQQYDAARKLIELLTQEHVALSGNDLQGLETIIAAKQECMARLEEFSHKYSARAHPQSAAPKGGITAWLQQCDPQGTWGLEPLWQQVEQLISQCRHKNGVNGKIITINHRRIQQALAILRQGEPGSEPCYSPTGSRPSSSSSRILGKV